MSRRPRRRKAEPHRVAPLARRPHRRRATVLVVVSVAVAAVTLWAAVRWQPPRRTAPAEEAMPLATLLDSVRAAQRVGDAARLVTWTGRWVAASPRDAQALRLLALARHNLAWTGSSSGAERSATRTSLDRIVIEKQTLALLDSSATNARGPGEWAQAQYWSGMIYENLGLTTDALRTYAAVQMQAPGTSPALLHASALMRYLRTPQPTPAPAPGPASREPSGP